MISRPADQHSAPLLDKRGSVDGEVDRSSKLRIVLEDPPGRIQSEGSHHECRHAEELLARALARVERREKWAGNKRPVRLSFPDHPYRLVRVVAQRDEEPVDVV